MRRGTWIIVLAVVLCVAGAVVVAPAAEAAGAWVLKGEGEPYKKPNRPGGVDRVSKISADPGGCRMVGTTVHHQTRKPGLYRTQFTWNSFPATLTPGQKLRYNFTGKAVEVQDGGYPGHAGGYMYLQLGTRKPDGSDLRVNTLHYTKCAVNCAPGQRSGSASKTGEWVVPGGVIGRDLVVFLNASGAGGSGGYRFIYKWVPDYKPDTVAKPKPPSRPKPPEKPVELPKPEPPEEPGEFTVELKVMNKNKDVKPGEKLFLRAVPRGGAKPYRGYLWFGKHRLQTASVVVSAASRTQTYTVAVTDSKGRIARHSVTIVRKQPAKPRFRVVVLATGEPGPYLVGQVVNLRALVFGGRKPYKYEWSGDRGWSGKNTSQVTYVTHKPKTHDIEVIVTDADGKKCFKTKRLIYEGVEVTVTYAGAPVSPNAIPAGRPVAFHARLNKGKLRGFKGPIYLLWQPHPEVTFKPFEQNVRGNSAGTTAVFNRSGKYTVWAEAYLQAGPVKITVGDGSCDEVTVVGGDD